MRTVALFALIVICTCAPSQAELIGRWDWTEPNPLVNRVNPGTYNAVLLGSATATGGVATVKGVYPGTGDLINFGSIAQAYGADIWTFTFEDVVLAVARTHILAGSLASGFAPGTWGHVQVNNTNPTAASATITVWGDAQTGSTGGKATAFGGLTVQTGVPYDMQFFFNGSNPSGSAGFRMRNGSSTTWGPITWASNPILRMTSDKGSPQVMLLGKYQAGSSLYGDFSVGEVSFSAAQVPEPSSMVLLLAGAAALLIALHRRR